MTSDDSEQTKQPLPLKPIKSNEDFREDIFEPHCIIDTTILNAKIIAAARAPAQQDPYYNYPQNQTPVYQQRLDGQPVYVQGGTPQNLDRNANQRLIQANDGTYYQIEDPRFTDSFDTVKIRNQFVRKVYTILSIQLLCTFGFMLLAMEVVVFLVLYLCFVYVPSLRRHVPTNFILLAIFTIALAYVATYISIHYSTIIVLGAMGFTGLICSVITIFAIQTKWDITGCGMLLCMCSLVVLLIGIIFLILSIIFHLEILMVIYSCLAAILFSVYLMYDTQQIVGGRRFELSTEEYIFAAITLYVDIVYIFIHILHIAGYCCR